MGTEIFVRLHGDWRNYQAAFLRDTLADPETYAWVAEADRRVVGFASAKLYERHLGEITMLAVDPDAQGQGIGSALTGFATEWLARRGMRVAMVETGGDGGHGAARHMYTNAGYVAVPIVRYFKAL